MTIQQIISAAGDGVLRDNTPCAEELRTFLSEVPTDKLAEYVDHCLSNKFNENGLVLQDLVNELGRRLDFTVSNGLYQGSQNKIGNDGLWVAPEKNSIVVEVKTTDAYRIPLDKIATYRDKLIAAGQIDDNSSILIVVGRQDTGELEAQVRGSRHAWDVRMISTDSLVKLVNLKESTDEPTTLEKIRSVLVPMEYTRLDALIDVLFTTAKDVESATEDEIKAQTSGEGENVESRHEYSAQTIARQDKRAVIVTALNRLLDATLVKKSRAMSWSSDHRTRAATAVSKRYENAGTQKYWYAYHPSWDSFLAEGDKAVLALGCMDTDFAFAIPYEVIHQALPSLHTTVKKDQGRMYWHLHILEPAPNIFELSLPKADTNLPLQQYRVDVTQN